MKYLILIFMVLILGCMEEKIVEVVKECPTPPTTTTVLGTTTTSLKCTTTSSTSTTSTIPVVCAVCPVKVCEFTYDEVKWMLNYKPSFGQSSYQSGGFDCKDDWLNYLKVPGRPKFKSRPARTGHLLTGREESTFCFVDLGGYFYLNRTGRMWSWNDDECHSSSLKITDV